MSGVASAPASSANLGPGFDALAIALGLRCHVTAEVADAWEIHEKGATFTPKPGDLVVRAVDAAVGRPIRLTIDNEVPRSRGLGSSAAVTAAAACAALRATGQDPGREEIFALVAELEGHGDNAAAAVHGGLVLASSTTWRRLPLADTLRFVAAIPDHHLSTHLARAALPAAIRLSAAARSIGRMGFLIDGLRTGDPASLRLATGDELHEQHRDHLSPVTGRLIDAALEAGAFHAAWSGAGPTALMITDAAHMADVLESAEKTLDGEGSAVVLDVDHDGLL